MEAAPVDGRDAWRGDGATRPLRHHPQHERRSRAAPRPFQRDAQGGRVGGGIQDPGLLGRGGGPADAADGRLRTGLARGGGGDAGGPQRRQSGRRGVARDLARPGRAGAVQRRATHRADDNGRAVLCPAGTGAGDAGRGADHGHGPQSAALDRREDPRLRPARGPVLPATPGAARFGRRQSGGHGVVERPDRADDQHGRQRPARSDRHVVRGDRRDPADGGDGAGVPLVHRP